VVIRFRSMLNVCAATLLCACGSGDHAVPANETSSAPDISTPPSESSADGSARSPAERLGLDETRAGVQSIDAVISGSGYSLIGSIITPFKALPAGERGDVVRGLALCLQAYYQSDAFKADYAKIRAERKPPQPTVYEQTPQQELDAALAHDRKELEEARASVLPMLPPESRAEVEESYKQNEKMLADPQIQKYRLMGIEADRAQRQADYEKSLQDWQTMYPEDPQPIIVSRLKAFLALTDDIDFDAKLIDAGGKKKFANPEYESKPWDWKWAYRSGKDSVSAAREVAKTWLDEVE
jgi:hypothetical protein